MERLTWHDIFLSLSQITGYPFNPFDSRNDTVQRPNTEQISWIIERATPPGPPRTITSVLKDAQKIFTAGHSRFLSHVPSPSSPESWLGDAVTAAFNPFAGSREAGSGVCVMETALVRWICDQFGLPEEAGGHFVSGASMANLTALTVARDSMLGEHIGKRDNAVAYISDQTHFCVAKALKIIGFSDHHLRVIKTNANFQMDPTELACVITRDLCDGRTPFAVIATSGTTNTGTIDPLEEIAHIAEKHNIWLHVDAAYGGSLAFSKTHRGKVDGLKYADSIAWDAHKWLFQTYGCGAVFFRRGSDPLKSFSVSSEIVESVKHGKGIRDPWNYGVELTRPARHMRLWVSLQVLGMDELDVMISKGISLAKLAEATLASLPDWEIMSSQGTAIVAFRYAPKGATQSNLDEINSRISRGLESEIATILTTRLKGALCLRMCTINPRTTGKEIKYVVNSLNRKAREVYNLLWTNKSSKVSKL
ncbi:LOW QUALITY PROTEIN: hypothetical protein IFM46972_11503 [Aspergillus udagawae]|uniref:L-2,4-diaminobutyrate decarboxylase n=1 Tax=Aspergillus udagawae TaxID=91492 RepID=A0A8H3SH59_9EURO|nr:LOW QUALITY PROTEIN: hypothetical protein IFM46972_11503 [Aspergillus udagawae]